MSPEYFFLQVFVIHSFNLTFFFYFLIDIQRKWLSFQPGKQQTFGSANL